jgi:hypothetical protein
MSGGKEAKHMSDAKRMSRLIFEEVWNNKNTAAIDELMAADYVHHDPQCPKVSEGREGYKQLVAHYLNAFPDSFLRAGHRAAAPLILLNFNHAAFFV